MTSWSHCKRYIKIDNVWRQLLHRVWEIIGLSGSHEVAVCVVSILFCLFHAVLCLCTLWWEGAGVMTRQPEQLKGTHSPGRELFSHGRAPEALSLDKSIWLSESELSNQPCQRARFFYNMSSYICINLFVFLVVSILCLFNIPLAAKCPMCARHRGPRSLKLLCL